MRIAGSTICVTGGAGFIGSHVVDALIAAGAAVTVIDDLSTGSESNLGSAPVRFVEGDITDPSIAAVAADADLVLHLAVRNVRASINRPAENFRVNADGTLELLEAMRHGACGRFVYISSSEVYGTAAAGTFTESTLPAPTTVYGAGKLAGELIALAYHRTYGMDVTVVRPFNNYGPRSHFEGDSGEVIPKFILRALAGEPLLIHGDGTQTRDFMYVEDTADWLVELAAIETLNGETVNIGYGEEISVNQLAAAVIEATGSAAPVEYIEDRPGDLPRLLSDVTRVKAHSSYTPRVGFADGLHRTISYVSSLGDPHDLLAQERARTWT